MTAKIREEEKEGVVHHLFSIVDTFDDRYAVTNYLEDFWKTVEGIFERGGVPVVVGGTNYYVEATLKQFIQKREALEMKEIGPQFRARVEDALLRLDFAEMYGLLKEYDGEAAKYTIKNDVRRVENALKRILNYTPEEGGVDSSDDGKKREEKIYDYMMIVLDSSNYEFLYNRLYGRIKSMVYDEGGMREIVDICMKYIIQHNNDKSIMIIPNNPQTTGTLLEVDEGDGRQSEKVDSFGERLVRVLHENVEKGVLQAIGYKEFFGLLSHMIDTFCSPCDSLEEIRSVLLSSVPKLLAYRSAGSESKDLLLDSIIAKTEECISRLASDTEGLTKKQRRYITNRLVPSLSFSSSRVSVLDITSVERFYEIAERVVYDVNMYLYHHTKETYRGGEDSVMRETEKKVYNECGYCGVSVVGEKCWAQHLKSKGHEYCVKVSRGKRKEKQGKKKNNTEIMKVGGDAGFDSMFD